jgi:hypothetical protein
MDLKFQSQALMERKAPSSSDMGRLESLLMDLRQHVTTSLDQQTAHLGRLLESKSSQMQVDRPPADLSIVPVDLTKAPSESEQSDPRQSTKEKSATGTEPRSGRFSVTGKPHDVSGKRHSMKSLAIDLEAKADEEMEREEACAIAVEKHLAEEQGNNKPQGRSMGRDAQPTDETYIDGQSAAMTWFRQFQLIIKSDRFDYAIGVIIIMNTIWIGLRVDYDLQESKRERSKTTTALLCLPMILSKWSSTRSLPSSYWSACLQSSVTGSLDQISTGTSSICSWSYSQSSRYA